MRFARQGLRKSITILGVCSGSSDRLEPRRLSRARTLRSLSTEESERCTPFLMNPRAPEAAGREASYYLCFTLLTTAMGSAPDKCIGRREVCSATVRRQRKARMSGAGNGRRIRVMSDYGTSDVFELTSFCSDSQLLPCLRRAPDQPTRWFKRFWVHKPEYGRPVAPRRCDSLPFHLFRSDRKRWLTNE